MNVNTVSNAYLILENEIAKMFDEQVINGPFYSAFSQRKLTDEQIAKFSIQYGHHRCYFHQLLGATIACAPPCDKWWAPIVENLYDECGRGVAGMGHGELYNTYLKSVIPDVELTAFGTPAIPAEDFIFEYNRLALDFYKNATYLEAFGYMGPGNELLTIPMYKSILIGLEERGYDLNFWKIHIEEVEEEHYGSIRNLLSSYEDEESLKQIENGAKTSIEHMKWFYNEFYDYLFLK
ncbi:MULTISPECIES: iron-containing redox enzyme family protein [Aneurinibacillus]|uniref:Iron-containing redox enzyme n=1 Tax=Aneurinibacillus thermoaerophilus TaxID=143495 RepID=A0A1G8BKG2_ANETH|nr:MULTISPECIES: iron-containing redox enzyme family protein [Aneurinibacillus]AMA73380.1 hypothetical protein ACH33_11295 [Aneurinibacillus sp. XH2]MED0676041.1 iron-containing redox enzyme family protein [Aneurinibacillus thermoaerophilus]MED0681098.1 iron-containing redox enzyme family protein [Aneurinibacillus thermoaerophilus]MED0736324.1 iron-containing redox enzyme family protein [Aneurinibacillus thermoaerophilus]MED0757390.1 iron-containing redox enzyme family protein [Aneurinibacillu